MTRNDKNVNVSMYYNFLPKIKKQLSPVLKACIDLLVILQLQNITASSKKLIAPVNNRNTIKKREICSKLTMKTPVVLLSYCYPWTNVTTFSSVTIIKFEQVNNCWAVLLHNWWVFNTFFSDQCFYFAIECFYLFLFSIFI